MKKIFIGCAAIILSISAFAEERIVVSVSGCTDYLIASPIEHKRTAVEDYRYKAFNKCADKGYGSWTTLYSKWSPGINLPFRCLKGKVRCHD